jgi:hypothetical protein
MQSKKIKLSKLVGEGSFEIRLIFCKDKVYVEIDFPIMNQNCKILSEHKKGIVDRLKKDGWALEQGASLRMKDGISYDGIFEALTRIEALLWALDDLFHQNAGEDNFFGRVASRIPEQGYEIASTYSIFDQSTASIILPDLEEIGYKQVENFRNEKPKIVEKEKPFIRKFLDRL